ncbi:CLUMA_CG021575, isoform A [Clunio marinus]|uniref:CLUMA_CG021575, isoform A n=1 Tax=Clunio marinus TaxID=568069 RepID=A0A1J1JA18_9DIPT|nr:CLUMA_CG021575, isoform A [Clunio marinus]
MLSSLNNDETTQSCGEGDEDCCQVFKSLMECAIFIRRNELSRRSSRLTFPIENIFSFLNVLSQTMLIHIKVKKEGKSLTQTKIERLPFLSLVQQPLKHDKYDHVNVIEGLLLTFNINKICFRHTFVQSEELYIHLRFRNICRAFISFNFLLACVNVFDKSHQDHSLSSDCLAPYRLQRRYRFDENENLIVYPRERLSQHRHYCQHNHSAPYDSHIEVELNCCNP